VSHNASKKKMSFMKEVPSDLIANETPNMNKLKKLLGVISEVNYTHSF
jgi:hypothetical protein